MTQTRPASMATQILEFLAQHPGQEFRCTEIAERLDRPTQQLASECGRLWRNGRVERVHSMTPGNTQPLTYYRAKVGA